MVHLQERHAYFMHSAVISSESDLFSGQPTLLLPLNAVFLALLTF